MEADAIWVQHEFGVTFEPEWKGWFDIFCCELLQVHVQFRLISWIKACAKSRTGSSAHWMMQHGTVDKPYNLDVEVREVEAAAAGLVRAACSAGSTDGTHI